MKKLIRLFLLLVFAQSAVSGFAQNERAFLTLKMRNGDIMTGITDIGSFTFKTAYGDLALPIKDVSAITFGINTYGVDRNAVRDMLDNIQNGSLTDASTSFDRLIRMEIGVLPYIKDYIESSSYKKRDGSDLSIDLVYDVLLSKYNIKKNFGTKDILQTTGATAIEGNYDFESLSLETDYGRLTVNRSKISSLSVSFKDVSNAGSGNFKLNANQHIAGNANGGWLSTGILVRKDQPFKILAAGVVNIASLSNNAYTPDGGVNGTPGPKSNDPSYGCLVFKVGDSGTVIKAGDTYSGRAPNTGIIYLSIYESVYNAANTGSYSAKISTN